MGTNSAASGTPKPRLYVACLAAYNEGAAHGGWIDATEDAWAMWSEVAAMLRASPILDANDFLILVCEGFDTVQIGKFDGLDRVANIVSSLSRPEAERQHITSHERATQSGAQHMATRPARQYSQG